MQTLSTWRRRSAFFLFTLLALAVAAYAFGYLYLPFRAGDSFAASFAISGHDVPAHFFLAGLALVLAPIQLSARLRRAAPGLHRLAGWLYVVSVLVGGIAGFTLAQDAQGGLPSRLGFSVLAIGWIGTTALGLRHAIGRDIERHRRWMARSVALTWGAVTLRLMLVAGQVAGLPFMQVYVVASWASWLLNLAVCEFFLRQRGVAATRWASGPSAA